MEENMLTAFTISLEFEKLKVIKLKVSLITHKISLYLHDSDRLESYFWLLWSLYTVKYCIE